MRSPNSLLLSAAVIGLFLLSVAAGYLVGERYLKPRPTPPGEAFAPSKVQPGPAGAARTPAPATPTDPPLPAVAPATPEPVPPSPAAPQPEPGPPTQPPEAAVLHRVQVGAFASRENADATAEALRAKGFTPYVVREGGLFKVRVGAFRDRSHADQLAERLRAAGFEVSIAR